MGYVWYQHKQEMLSKHCGGSTKWSHSRNQPSERVSVWFWRLLEVLPTLSKLVGDRPGGNAEHTGEATYLHWPRNASDSHRRSLKILLGEGCLDSPLARFPVSLFFWCTFQKNSASSAYDCSCCCCCCFTFPILLYNHHSLQLVNIVQSEKFKSSPYGQLSRFFFRVSE